MLKDGQEKEAESQQRERSLAENEKERALEVERKLRDIQIEHEKLRAEYQKVQNVKGAYNADKKVFLDKISELEDQVKEREQERKEVEHRF